MEPVQDALGNIDPTKYNCEEYIKLKGGLRVTEDRREYVCTLNCGWSGNTLKSWEKHENEEERLPYSCPASGCKKNFPRFQTLKLHYPRFHTGPLRCKIADCLFRFETEVSLNRHIMDAHERQAACQFLAPRSTGPIHRHAENPKLLSRHLLPSCRFLRLLNNNGKPQGG
jgi:hypothetical protein